MPRAFFDPSCLRASPCLALNLMLLSLMSVGGCGTVNPAQVPADTAQANDESGSDSATDQDSASDHDGDAIGDAKDAATDAVADGTDAAIDDGSDVTDEDAVSDAVSDSSLDDAADTGKDVVGDVPPEDAGKIGKTIHSTACTQSADCTIPCATGACISGTCSYGLKGGACLVPMGGNQVACYGAGLADDVTPCLSCAPQVATNKLSSLSGAVVLNGLGEGVATADSVQGGMTWNFDSKRSISGGFSLYFGDPTTHTYANGKQVAGTATLPPIPVPKTAGVSPSLSFWLWMDTEATADFDFLTVNVIDGAATVPLWNSNPQLNTTHGSWQRVTLDVSAWSGKSVTVQFAFDSIDASVNAYEGVYVDQVEISTGCCSSPADCDDGNACSADTCAPSGVGTLGCVHTSTPNCCNTPGDCNDGKLCTLDLCPTAGGQCQHSAKVDCCMIASDCDDQDSCTLDTCSGAGGGCKHQNTCCKSDGECQSADPCLVGSCASGTCIFASTCCQKDSDCDDFNTCTNDSCASGACVHGASTAPGCCAPNLITANFDASSEGFDLTSSSSTIGWHYKAVTDSSGGIGVLAFGDPNSASYSVSASAKLKAVAATPALTLLAGNETTFAFSYRADTVTSNFTLRVFAVIDGSEVTLATKSINSFSTSWQTVSLDLSALAGKNFAINFEGAAASTFGNVINTQIYLDNVQVDSTCLPKKCDGTPSCNNAGYTLNCYTGVCTDGICSWPYSCCDTDGDCNDNGLCTADKCINKKCQFQPIKDCCMGNNDCNDANPCTTDTCGGPGAICTFAVIAGCCTSSGQCDDANKCTIDTCSKNVCKNAQSCCSTDKDCDDGETKCTTDTCVNQVCAHKSTGAPGCCQAETFVNDFDGLDAKGMTFVNSAGSSQGWQIWGGSPKQSPNSPSSKGILYYGDPNVQNYNFGANNGTATLPATLLDGDVISSLKFDLYMETESGSYDDLTITANGTQLWKKSQQFTFSTSTWTTLSLDLSQFKGQTVTIVFTFNTGDSILNSTFGVAIDNLKILAACP